MTPATASADRSLRTYPHDLGAWATMTTDDRKRAATNAATNRDVDALIALALAHIEHRRNRPNSDSTRATYAWALRHLLNAWVHVPILQATHDDAERYLAEVERSFSISTAYVCAAAAEALYRALRWAGATDAAPWADVRVKGRDKRRKHQRRDGFTDAEVNLLLKHADDPAERVLVLLGARVGLRSGEMLALRWDDLHTSGKVPHVRVGGRASRRVTLTPEVLSALDALALSPTTDGDTDLERVLPWRYSAALRWRLHALADRAGVTLTPGKSITSLRHACGTELYARTGDLLAVAAHLGHSTLTQTASYIERANETNRPRTTANAAGV